MTYALHEGYDDETVKWLNKNKLNHLMETFKENHLTIGILLTMNSDRLQKTFKILGINELKANMLENDIENIKTQKNNQLKHIIITDAEIFALNNLDNKYKELLSKKKIIENKLTECNAEYIKQQNILNKSFNNIILNIKKRQNILLTDMKIKNNKYTKILTNSFKNVSNNCNILLKTKNQINQHTLSDTQIRSNKVLLNINNDNKYNINCNKLKYNISMNKILNDIQKWGIIGNIPPQPIMNIVYFGCNAIMMELLMNQDFKQKILKYELNITPKIRSNTNMLSMRYLRNGTTNAMIGVNNYNTDPNDMKDQYQNNYDVIYVNNTNNENIGFHQIYNLQTSTYKIRVRAIMRDNINGEWTQWHSVEIQSMQMHFQSPQDLNSRYHQYFHKYISGCIINTVNEKEWIKALNTQNILQNKYSQQRIFNYLVYLAQHFDNCRLDIKMLVGYIPQNVVAIKEPRIGPRQFVRFMQSENALHAEYSNEWKEFQHKISTKVLNTIAYNNFNYVQYR